MGRVTRRPRIRRAAAAIAAFLLIAGGASLAAAEGVLRLDGPVTDSAGVLGGRVAEIEETIDRTLEQYHVQVFVLFVDTTGDIPMADYAAQTAATRRVETARR